MPKTITPQPITVQSLAEAHPPYAEMLTRRSELEARRAELEDDLSRLRRGKAPRHSAVEGPSEHAERAAALISDVVPDASDYRLPGTKVQKVGLYEELQQELDAVNGALAILRATLPEAKATANRKVVDAVRADYEALLRQLAVAVAKVIPLHERYSACLRDLEHNDVAWLGRLPQPESIGAAFGYMHDDNSKAQRFVRDCVAAGVVGAHEVEAAYGH